MHCHRATFTNYITNQLAKFTAEEHLLLLLLVLHFLNITPVQSSGWPSTGCLAQSEHSGTVGQVIKLSTEANLTENFHSPAKERRQETLSRKLSEQRHNWAPAAGTLCTSLLITAAS